MSGWMTVTGTSEAGNRVSHVIPIDDLREHSETADCWCDPFLDYEDMIVIHSSADGREAYETGERKPQ